MTIQSSDPAGIKVTGLTKSFGSIEAVFRGIDLEVAPGETVALLGPNGAGKSTTIDMMLGLSAPRSRDGLHLRCTTGFGSRSWMGREHAADRIPPRLPQGARAGHDGRLSLSPPVRSGRGAGSDRDLEELAERRTNKLSGGQTQRVRFAITLVANPNLVLLDEPTASIDVEGRHAFWSTMRSVAARGTTVIFATHYLEEADAFADRIVLLARGRVVADGPATEIKAKVGGRSIRATLPCRCRAARRPGRRDERGPTR